MKKGRKVSCHTFNTKGLAIIITRCDKDGKPSGRRISVEAVFAKSYIQDLLDQGYKKNLENPNTLVLENTDSITGDNVKWFVETTTQPVSKKRMRAL